MKPVQNWPPRMIARMAATGLTAVGLAGLVACGGSSARPLATVTRTTPAPATTVTTVVTTSSTVTDTSSASSSPFSANSAGAPTLDYGQQFLTDVQPWNVALAAVGHAGLKSPAAVAAGQQAVVASGHLLNQSWPAADEGDVHALAVQFATLNEDIMTDNETKFLNDATTLNADANVVRAELGLPSIS